MPLDTHLIKLGRIDEVCGHIYQDFQKKKQRGLLKGGEAGRESNNSDTMKIEKLTEALAHIFQKIKNKPPPSRERFYVKNGKTAINIYRLILFLGAFAF